MTLRFPLLTLLCLWALLMPSAAAAHTEEEIRYLRNVSLRVLDFDAKGLTFELLNENPQGPDQPQRRTTKNFWLAAVADGSLSLSIEEADWAVYQGGKKKASYGKDEQGEDGRIPPQFESFNPRYIDDFRTIGLNQVQMVLTTPISGGGNLPKSAVLERAVIRANFRKPAADRDLAEARAELQAADPYLLEMAPDMVLNHEQVPLLATQPKTTMNVSDWRNWYHILKSGNDNGPVARFRVTEPGIYRLSPRDLDRIGVDPAKLRLDRLRVYVGNQEIPTLLSGNDDGPFLARAHLTFYVPKPKDPRFAYIPIWVLQPDDEVAGGSPLRIASDDRDPKMSRTPPQRASTTHRIFHPESFDLRYPFDVHTGHWAMALVGPEKFREATLHLDHVDTSQKASVTVTHGPIKQRDVRPSYDLKFYVNGVLAGEDGQRSATSAKHSTFSVPANALRAEENTFGFLNDRSSGEIDTGEMVIYRADVRVPLDWKNLPLNQPIELSNSAEGPVLVDFARTEGVRRDYPIVLDVTKPYEPVLLNSRSSLTQPVSHASAWIWTPSSRPIEVIAADSEGMRWLGEGRPYQVNDILSPENGADILVISADLFVDTAKDSYAYLRGVEDGYRVQVVNFDDILAVANGGWMAYEPIKDFIAYAYARWSAPRLSKVVLIGEASETWFEYSHPGAAKSTNYLPAWGWANPGVKIHCDDSYALISGDGPLADVEIGRFPVKSRNELGSLVKRISDYEKNPEAGPWLTRHLFITDDEPEFEQVSEKVIETELHGNAVAERIYLQRNPYEDYFRIFARKRSPETTERIVEEMSKGALTATYFGHGGPNLWSGERIFHYRDIYRLTNGQRRPIMAAASCDTAWIDYPVDPVARSLAEQFILAEDGGAIAVFAPVDGTSSYEHDFLLRHFFDVFTNEKTATLGPVTILAKAGYLLDRGQAYVPNQYILLGDPALKIPRPSGRIRADIAPGAIFTTSQSVISIKGEVAGMDWGVAEALLIDPKGAPAVEPARGRVVRGRFDLSLQMPAYLDPGQYKLSLRATNEASKKFETVSVELPVRAPDVSLDWSVSPGPGPKDVYEPGQLLDITLRAENLSEGYMDKLKLEIQDVSNNRPLNETPLVLPAREPFERTFRVPVPPGIMILKAVIRYQDLPETVPALAEAEVVLKAPVPGTNPWAAVPRGRVTGRVAGTPASTTFDIDLYSTSDRAIQTVRAKLFLVSEGGELKPVGREAEIPVLEPGERERLSFLTPVAFPQEELPFRLEVTARPHGEIAPPPTVLDFPIEIGGTMDLVVVPASVQAERSEYLSGQTVYVTATVQNRGNFPAENVRTALYVDSPWWNETLATSLVAPLQRSEIEFDTPLLPGEKRDVRLRWDPPAGQGLDTTLYVVTNSNRLINEASYLNNLGEVKIQMRRMPNLALDSAALQASQKYIRLGDTVNLTLPFRNDSPFDFAHPFVLEVTATGNSDKTQTVYRGGFDRLNAGEAGVLQATWHVEDERNLVRVSLNDDREYGESSSSDNNATIAFEYVFKPMEIARRRATQWSFASIFPYGVAKSVMIMPDDTITLPNTPKAPVRLSIAQEDIVGDPIPYNAGLSTDSDNLMSTLKEDGGLYWTPYEDPAPVKVRVPLPADDRTVLYDISLVTAGEKSPDGKPANYFRFRVEGDSDFRNPSSRSSSREFLGRINTIDDHLDIEFAPDRVRSWNGILWLEVAAVEGTYLSPLIELDGEGLAPGTFEARKDLENGQVLFEIRTGTGNRFDPRFGPWRSIASGDPLPAGPDVETVQWRATVIGDESGLPRIDDVLFRFDDSSDLAQATANPAPGDTPTP
ncbi:MAG: C25 family cysteine peptidase [Sumerlaeia bacterium]